MAPKYTVFQKPDGTHGATFDTTFQRFFANDCTAIYTGVAGNQTGKLMRELNNQKPAPRPNPEPMKSTPTIRFAMDTDSGLGIGGINNDQSMPIIPSVRAIERVQKMYDTDTICKRCRASANFDGAMFTTLGGTNICDDCA